MQIETVGNYQIHLIAHELSGEPSRWDPFVTVFKFDEGMQDFKCVLEKRHASNYPFDSYEGAIEAARRMGTAFIQEDMASNS